MAGSRIDQVWRSVEAAESEERQSAGGGNW